MIFTFLPDATVRGHHLLPKHDLQCSNDFPCPKEIKRRIDFWIQVFKGWSQKQAIFHDPNVPERVYAVVTTGHGCSSKVRSKVKKERKQISNALIRVSKKVANNQPITGDDRHLGQLFAGASAKTIRRAARSIRCQSGVKESYLGGLQRFHRYSEMVDRELEKNRLPPDIRYLPFVESSYNPAAYSKAGAAGMWQIMPQTARVLGLELNATIDERLDPESATRAAAKYLVNARKTLTKVARSVDPSVSIEQINPFVITSYNYGVRGMSRAIKKVKPDYLSVLEKYKSPSFQVAVKNFYASFLAAKHVAIHSDEYFGDVAKAPKLNTLTLVLKRPTSIDRIKKVFGLSERQLKPLNRALTRYVWNGWRLIPEGYRLKLPPDSNRWQSQVKALRRLPAERRASGAENYVVRKGDTACGIARALRVNCRQLINANQLGKRALIRIGQKLVIPRKVVTEGYTVKKGDTACGIAKRYGVKCRDLIAVNQLGRKAIIVIGQQLAIPGGAPGVSGSTRLNAENLYVVKKGDSACRIAKRFAVNCAQLRTLNQLDKVALIYPGQKLKIPGHVLPGTTQTAEQLAQLDATIKEVDENPQHVSKEHVELQNLLDTLPELSVSASGSSDNPIYTIRVEPDETVGHYADWLGLRSTRKLRRINNLSSSSRLTIGKTIKLPADVTSNFEKFEQKRIDYHQVLSESLKEHYSLVGLERYAIKRGDSIWSLSTQHGFPVWLLYRLNPTLKNTTLSVGQPIILPKMESKTSS